MDGKECIKEFDENYDTARMSDLYNSQNNLKPKEIGIKKILWPPEK